MKDIHKMKRPWSGAYVCVFNRDFSEILLLWRKKEKRGKTVLGWGNVGGTIKHGEKPLHACIREAKEEIGISLSPKSLAFICVKSVKGPGQLRWPIYFYAASIGDKTRIQLSSESRGYAWFKKNELPDKTLDSEKDILDWWQIARKTLQNA
ncbi:MAG: NUDIX hydrolase [Candidatus Micrarchaeia archaeon]